MIFKQALGFHSFEKYTPSKTRNLTALVKNKTLPFQTFTLHMKLQGFSFDRRLLIKYRRIPIIK